MGAAKEQVATRITPADRARVKALIVTMPEALRGRSEATEADALRELIKVGLTSVEAIGWVGERGMAGALRVRGQKVVTT